jgi:DNA modification methylase
MIYHGDFRDFDIKADVVITEPLYLRDLEDKITKKKYRKYDEYIEEILSHLDAPVICVFQPDWREIPDVFKEWTVSTVYTGGNKDYLLSNTGEPGCYRGPGAGRNPRPYEIMRPVVETFSRPGDTVYDPFMGYGSTGLACKGRNFIGIERRKDFFDLCERHSL